LIELGVDSRSILALTFTNKAAEEMKHRVERHVPGHKVWISTFHRFCARLLRQRAAVIGLESNYSIYDTNDQVRLIRQVMDSLDLDSVHHPPTKIARRISWAKNHLVTAEEFVRQFEESVGDHMQAIAAQVYPEYQRALLRQNAVDFDDLLLHIVTLLTENPEIRSELDSRNRFVLVDEFQDTNLAQYSIASALSQDQRNLCVTGDPDQSIYGWRGARIENILKFETDYSEALVVRLEQNFRSTANILRSADELIQHNRYRKPKSLLTDNADGAAVEWWQLRTGTHETDAIATRIGERSKNGERSWSDFAIFYRVNALSREIEQALLRHQIPYQVAAGVAFYERAEVKDLLAYLQLIHNPRNHVAFLRIVNKPLRGIGKKSLVRLANFATRRRFSLLEAARQATEVPRLTRTASKALTRFAAMIDELSTEPSTVEELLVAAIGRSGYVREWEEEPTEQDSQHLSVVNELVVAARQYDQIWRDEASLEGFLETCSLVSDVDDLNSSAGKVTLMTLHAAKGLEFPEVFIIGVEQSLIPHERVMSADDPKQYEEERRLLFVGMTRARERLTLTSTVQRETRGRQLYSIPSPFLSEMQLTFIDHTITQQEHPESNRSALIAKLRSEMKRDDPRPLLTTGAALLSGDARSVEVPQRFGIGARVRHPQYGPGVVISVSGLSKRRTLTVQFEDAERTETFVESASPLQPIGIR
jgi:DNA helicase-2/ATP-dependent DNA helicase PcrA